MEFRKHKENTTKRFLKGVGSKLLLICHKVGPKGKQGPKNGQGSTQRTLVGQRTTLKPNKRLF